MGWITDLFEGVPLSSELIAKLHSIEARLAVLEPENVALKIETERLKKQIAEIERERQQFQKENQDLRKTRELTHADSLNNSAEMVLTHIYHNGSTPPGELATRLPGTRRETVEVIKELVKLGYLVIRKSSITGTQKCNLTKKASEYLEDNFLK